MHKITLNNYEKGLIVAILFTPFTLLRFGYIGFGEAGILLLFIFSLSQGYIKKLTKDHLFSHFWLLFIVVSFIGIAYNTFFLDIRSAPAESVLFDLASYVFITITCLTVENLCRAQKLNPYALLKYTFLLSGMIFFILFLLSLKSNSIFGLPLNHFGHFSPLAANLHQIAMYIAPMPFIGILLIEKDSDLRVKIVSIIWILLFSYLVIETGSFKAFAGLILGFVTYTFYRILRLFPLPYRKRLTVLFVLIIVLLVVSNFQVVTDFVIEIFRAEDTKEGRSSLYSTGLDVALRSPFIGLGPGAHVFRDGKFWDSHQTLITVFIQVGIIGLVLLLVMLLKFILLVKRFAPLMAGFVPILIYLMGGDIMRRLPIWLLLLFFYYCAHKFRDEGVVN